MIHCVAIDDEPIALSIIKEYCDHYGDIELHCFTSPVDGMDFIRETNPDIVFLDIEMNSHNGLQLAGELQRDTLLIFTTAFSQYALDGFNVNAIDFLHKPIFYPRFQQAMEKARAWLSARNATPVSHGSITLKSGYKNVIIDLDTVMYVEAMDNYIKIYRRDLPTVISQITMKELESMLPEDGFIRVHRSFIVAFRAIDRFSNRRIFMRGVENHIPVGRTFTDTFISRYKNHLNHLN